MVKLTENFSLSEFECHCGCGFDAIDLAFVDKLQELRERVGHSIKIRSGCRCPDHNRLVGGKSKSAHLRGTAVDIKCFDSRKRFHLINQALLLGIKRVGIARTFIHLDVDTELPEEVIWLY